MAIFLLLGWWYGPGWAWVVRSIDRQLKGIAENFSVSTLLRTWFSPWKQIQSVGSFHNFWQTAADNTISRFIGATVRSIMLFTAAVLSLLVVVAGTALIVLWPLLPIAVVALPILTLTGQVG